MAKTGIKITTVDTVLGAPIDVNTTSMIVIVGGSTTSHATQLLRGSVDSISNSWWETSEGKVLKPLAETYYSVNNGANSGKLLYVSAISDLSQLLTVFRLMVSAYGFDKRPRQVAIIGYSDSEGIIQVDPASVQEVADDLQSEGIRCVFVTQDSLPRDSWADSGVTDADSPFVSACVACSKTEPYNDGAVYAVAQLAQISVGTSIGDGGLTPTSEPSCILFDFGEDYKDVANFSLAEIETLGELGYLFTRTRPPRNGLWWNDGATCNDPANALSTLEAARTICAMADDLQSFFVPYINTRVPVTSTGDIQSAYKQVVLDNARAAVVQKYIESGDISDARINLVAKDNDMIGTRTWEVTLSILPAPTLRWIDGYVFYVKSL